MTGKRLIIGFLLALALQGTVFAWQYRDLLYLRRPAAVIEQEGHDSFVRNATSALSRDKLTRSHLDTMADAAVRLNAPDIEIRALGRRSELDPADVQIKMRLGDALRRAQQFDAAERVYQEILSLNSRRP